MDSDRFFLEARRDTVQQAVKRPATGRKPSAGRDPPLPPRQSWASLVAAERTLWLERERTPLLPPEPSSTDPPTHPVPKKGVNGVPKGSSWRHLLQQPNGGEWASPFFLDARGTILGTFTQPAVGRGARCGGSPPTPCSDGRAPDGFP